MTPEAILLKLTKRSTPATAAFDVWLAQRYSLADLTNDLIKMAMENTMSTERNGIDTERGLIEGHRDVGDAGSSG